jgi:hypothetical protein
MLTKVARPTLALTASLALVLAVANPAHAGGRGVAAGIAVGTLLGLGIAGAYAAPYGPAYYGAPVYYDAPGCYPGPRQCAWTARHCWYSRWGEYICRGGEWRCWRASICD